ncbi:MAG TPA: hypothetical protein V6C58_20250, partial [Allocoleopsis sp.]
GKVSHSFGAVRGDFGNVDFKSGTSLGALNLATETTFVTTTGAATGTLGAGRVGQVKRVVLAVDGGNFVLTPNSIQGGTTLTFDDPGDSVSLVYNGSKWFVLSNNGVTLA